MGASKIKGHRIADKAIKMNHFDDSVKFSESDRLTLNFPTHDNGGDLTVSQKNVLTQMGNADALHYHVGGGGGPQGIYTDQQRDIQLLKLSMLISSTKYGMDQSVKDILDDDTSLYYGIHAAQSPALRNITDDSSVGGLLLANTTYTYGVAYETLFGETDVINTSMIKTAAGANNAVELTFSGVPGENTGCKIFRSIGQVPRVIVENEQVSEWTNPYNLPIDVNGTDKTSGLDCIKVSAKGFVNSAGAIVNNVVNIIDGPGKRILNDGQQLNVQVGISAPFDYLIQVNNKAVVNRIDIIWDANPANIPLDYEVYYTTDEIPTNIGSVNWKKFSRLQKVANIWNIPLTISTDGTITGNYAITGNTRSTNAFTFATVNNITAIKITAKNLMSRCQLNDVRLFTEQNSTNLLISKDWSTPNDFSQYKTLVMDIKSNAPHFGNLKTGFVKGTETITGAIGEVGQTLTTKVDLTGYSVRNSFNPSNSTTTFNHAGNDRIRVFFTPEPGQYLRMENIYLMFSSYGHVHNNTRNADADCQTVIVPITFNNGLPYYDGTPTGQITSDWCYIPFPAAGINWLNYVVSFRVISGALRCKTDYEYCNAYKTKVAGYEGSLIWSTTANIEAENYNYLYVSRIEYGKSNAQYMDLDYFEPSVVEKWHRHYIPMPAAAGSQDVKKLALFFNNITADQDVFIDNIYVTRAFDTTLTSGVVLKCSAGGINPTNAELNDASYYQSDLTPTNASPKTLMVDYGTTLTKINRVNLLYGYKANAAKSWAIQYSLDSTATPDDPFDSPKWSPISSLIIGESGIPNDFAGNVVNNCVYNNNIWAGHIMHTFTPVECTKLRIMFFGTIGDSVVRVANMRVFSADDIGTMSLIYKKTSNIADGWKFVDDGKPTGTENPSLFNTTGSYNILFDKVLQVVRLIDKSKNGVIHFNELTLPLYLHLILSSQHTGDIVFWVSNDKGKTYSQINVDSYFSFPQQSESLRIKAELKSPDAALSAFALLYSL